jgi:hypothetical protein
MSIKIFPVLLTLFIFGINTQGWANPVKSMQITANQITTMKMDENKIAICKKIEATRESVKTRPQLIDSLDKVIFSYEFTQNAWRDKFLSFREFAEIKSPNIDLGQSALKPYVDGNKYFEEGRILKTFKLLQSKRDELFKVIFMGFRLSFAPTSGHMFLEMNVTPSTEKGPGVIIPF